MEIINTNEDDLRLYPLWKHAVSEAIEQFQYGDVIFMDWLHKQFGIEKPMHGGFKQFQDYQFAFLESLDKFRKALLEDHNMAIDNVRGLGYRVVMPYEQTELAEKRMREDIGKSLLKASKLLSHVAIDMLDAERRKENMDARCRLASLSTMMRARIKVGSGKNKQKAITEG